MENYCLANDATLQLQSGKTRDGIAAIIEKSRADSAKSGITDKAPLFVSKFKLEAQLGGLLTGISNITESSFYSDNLLIAEAGKLLEAPKLFSTVSENNDGNSFEIENELKVMEDRSYSFIISEEL